MKKVYWLIALLILIFGSSVALVSAHQSPTNRIDGQLRSFDPFCQIVDNRTMVPLRFVMEDPAFQAKVQWDGRLQKVTIQSSDKTFELFIGNRKVLVDGKSVYLDTAPYIYQNRTFVPIRFLAEQLGATVSWNAAISEVEIETNRQTQVFAYYYYNGLDELKANGSLMTDIAFRWFETNGQGELNYEYEAPYNEILDFARSKGIKTHASVMLMGQESLHNLLSNPENRGRLVDNLGREITRSQYDGVNIDFEFLAPSDAGNFVLFLQELKAKIGPDVELSVAVFARTANDKWATGYDYKGIGATADKVVVMAYDYHYATDSPGPIAPLWWTNQVVDYMVSVMPREKILLGMATYGYDWPEAANGTTVTAEKLAAVKSQYNVTERFDLESMSPTYTYVDESGVSHQIWMEDERSLQEKWKLAEDNGLGGISFWRIGTGFDDLYQVIEKN